MKKFRILSILVAFVCMIGMFGCSNNTSGGTTQASDTSKSSAEKVEAVTQKTVYVTPKWLNSALNGEQKGYEDLTILEIVYDDSAAKGTYDQGHIKGAVLAADVDVEDADGTE